MYQNNAISWRYEIQQWKLKNTKSLTRPVIYFIAKDVTSNKFYSNLGSPLKVVVKIWCNRNKLCKAIETFCIPKYIYISTIELNIHFKCLYKFTQDHILFHDYIYLSSIWILIREYKLYMSILLYNVDNIKNEHENYIYSNGKKKDFICNNKWTCSFEACTNLILCLDMTISR